MGLLTTVSAVQTLLPRTGFDNRDAALSDILAQIGTALGADRAYLFGLYDTIFVQNTHEWCAEGIVSQQDSLQVVPFDVGRRFWRSFQDLGYFALPKVDALPDSSELRQVLQDQQIKSLLAVPLWDGPEITGFLGVDYVRATRDPAKSEIAALQSLAASIALYDRAARVQARYQHSLGDLRAAHDRIAALASAMPTLMVESDMNGIITGFQQAEPLLFALAPDEVIGKTPEQILPPTLAEIARKAMRQTDAAGWSESLNYTLTIADEVRHFSLHAHALRPRHRDRGHNYLLTVRDITDSARQAHLARQLGLVAELSSNLIILTDKDQRVSWMNPEASSRTGFCPKHAKTLTPMDVLGLTRNAPEIARDFLDRLRQGAGIVQEVQVFDRNAVPYWVRLNIQHLRDATGAVQGYMVVGSDITSLKLAEARVLADRTTMLDASHEGIAMISANGRFSFINKAMRSLLQVNRSDDALHWRDIMPEELGARLQEIMASVFGKGHWSGEFSMPSDGQEMRVFDLSVTAQDDGSLLAIMRDISARKAAIAAQMRLREQLQIAQSRQLVAQLASGLAHDFSNILAIMNISLLGLHKKLSPDLKPDVARIQQASDQAATLVARLMAMGRADVQHAPVDLTQIAQQSAEMVRPGLPDHTRLEVSLPTQPVTVMGDETALMQVVLNLLINARDANSDAAAKALSAKQGKIGLSVGVHPSPDAAPRLEFGHLSADVAYAVIDVTDSGPGIAPKIRNDLFTPHVTTKGQGGMGLGLSVTRDILLACGGALQVDSVPDQGARFRVFLPCHDPAKA